MREPRDLRQEARDLARGKQVNAALGKPYRRVAIRWLREVAAALKKSEHTIRQLKVALAYCPEIDPCPDCGWPKLADRPCSYCHKET